MSRSRTTGITLEAQVERLEHDRELAADELARLERRYDVEHAALVRIANAESGVWGTIAHEALVAARAAAP